MTHHEVSHRSLKTDIPDYATHYHLSDRRPFLNLSDLEDERSSEVIRDLQELRRAGRNTRLFGRTYVLWRRATERKMRELFLQAGGEPERQAPHYFVLGSCHWFERLAPDTLPVAIPLAALPTNVTSFTYPDSFGAMGLGPEFGQPYEPRPYHGRVYRMEELGVVVETHGLPDGSQDEDYEGYHL
ncbi:MAG: hypothetical protein ABIS18_00600, partial [Actinomycetota bacterium]